MRPRTVHVLLALACASGCTRHAGSVPVLTSVSRPVRALPPTTGEPGESVEATLARLTLREQAAQMVWPSIVGDYVPLDDAQWTRIVRWVQEDHVGGFTVSVGSPFDIATKLDAMQRLASVPLLFGADLEAGAGFRARGGVFLPNVIELGGATWTPPLMAVGATGDTVLAYELGRVTAIEGRALGMHIVYGPVLDVNNNPANPVINVRSFGEDPSLVARLGAAFIRGVQTNGMLATGKHFPGHGDTDVNSHLALPEVDASRARLDSVELVPFRAAVAAGVGAIMTFHGALPALDASGVPATLSPVIIGRLLRGEMGFRGLAITDAMDMRGVLDRFGAVEATQRAVAAGADVLIQPEDARATIDAIVAGVEGGRYPAARVADAARRILALKAQLVPRGGVGFDPAAIRAVVGAKPHRALADTIAARSFTVVQDRSNAVPLRRGARVLSVTVARRADAMAGVFFDAALRAAGTSVRSTYLDADAARTPDYAAVLAMADSVDAVVVGSYVATRWDAASLEQSSAFITFMQSLSGRRVTPVLIAFGNPYLWQQVPQVSVYCVAWSGGAPSQAAAARALAGTAAIVGRLPISIPPLARRGEGVRRAAR